MVGLNNDINGSAESDTDGFGSSNGVNNCAGIVGSDLYVTSSDNVILLCIIIDLFIRSLELVV